MKINHIRTTNFIGARRIDMALDTPVTLIAGRNGAGKTSLAQAITAALTGDISRVSLKKECGELVSDGSKKGEARIATDAGEASITLPDGKHIGLPMYAATLPYVLNPAHFARQEVNARRAFLFDLAGLKITTEAVRAALLERGGDKNKIEAVLPLLRSGFKAASDQAKTYTTEARGAWKAVTGEVYGSQKADGWRAQVPEFDAARLADIDGSLERLEAQIEEQAKVAGALEEQHRQYRMQAGARATLAEKADKMARISAKLSTDEKELTEFESKVAEAEQKAGTGPRVGLVHDLARAVDYLLGFVEIETAPEDDAARVALVTYEAQYGRIGDIGDPEATARLPELIKARDLLKRSVENDRRDFDEAKAAQAALTAQALEPVDEAKLTDARENLGNLRNQRRALEAERQHLQEAQRAATAADGKTRQAAQHHADVLAWTVIADALSPDGIPGEMLAQALKPLNDLLRTAATDTGWMQATIDADMTVRANGRLYSLLSESEQWRVDAMIAYAVSQMSGLRLMLLDRMDVLELQGRSELLGWLDTLAAEGEIDTAIVFGTLKSLPALPETYTGYWIENGAIGALKEAA